MFQVAAKYLTSPLHSLTPHLAYLCLTNTLSTECPPSIPQHILWDKGRRQKSTFSQAGGTLGINDMDFSVNGLSVSGARVVGCLDPDPGLGVRTLRRWPQTYRPTRRCWGTRVLPRNNGVRYSTPPLLLAHHDLCGQGSVEVCMW